MLARWTEIAASLSDWLYPRVCPGCDQVSDRPGRHLCWSCLGRVELHTESLCSVCGAPVEGNPSHAFVCSVCRADRPAFDKARAAGRFQGVLRDQIHQFKYGRALWLKHDLADLLHGCLIGHFAPEQVDVVVPVPLHPVRLRERSYNQAAILSQLLARRIGRRCDGASLARLRKTDSQTRFDAVHRRQNIRGAFDVVRPEWVAGRCVLLVDDVMTTGATLNECARVLKRSGARLVWGVTVGRG